MTGLYPMWPRGKRGERGLVLVLAVFAVTLILVLAVGLSTAVRAELLASRTSLERSQSLFLAEAGINQARAILLYEDPNVDTLQDPWGLDAEEPLDQPQSVGQAGYYRVRVEDACGRIDINAADFPTLVQLTGDPSVATAIIDWRTQGSLEGYYRGLPYPYLPRKGVFQSPGELLLVQGVTPEMYFGTKDKPGLVNLVTVASESLNTTADGKTRISLNGLNGYGMIDDWAQRIVAEYGGTLTVVDLNKIAKGLDALHATSQSYTSLGQLVTVAQFYEAEDVARIVDYFTVETTDVVSGKVNVNTAPWAVLAALPGSSSSLADALVKDREKQPFASLAQVTRAMFANGGQDAFVQMIDHVTTKSSCFIIEAMGYPESGRSYRTLHALVHRTRTRRPDEFTLRDQVIVLRETEEDAPLPPPVTQADSREHSRRSRLAAS